MAFKPILASAFGLAMLCIGGTAGATDIAGAWQIHGSVFFNAVDTVCLFKSEGDAVTATCENDGKPGAYTPATVANGKVAWNWDSGPAVLSFQATMTSATAMKGEITVRGFTGKFTATKQ